MKDLESFVELLCYVEGYNLHINVENLKQKSSLLLTKWIEQLIEDPQKESIRAATFFLLGLRRGTIEPDLTLAQNLLYETLRKASFRLSSRTSPGKEEKQYTPDLFIDLAELASHTGIDTDRIRHQFLSAREKS